MRFFLTIFDESLKLNNLNAVFVIHDVFLELRVNRKILDIIPLDLCKKIGELDKLLEK